MKHLRLPVKAFAILFIFISGFITQSSFGQAGQLDALFNTQDNGTNIQEGGNGDVKTITVQADGKILIGGLFTSFNGIAANHIARLNADGSVDGTFISTGTNGNIHKILLQSDGKIIIAGKFTTANGSTANAVARLNADGTSDATFSTGTGFNDSVNVIVLQTNGKLLAGGNFTTYNGVAANYIARLNANGAKDATFNGSTLASTVNDIALQSNGKLIVGLTGSVFLKRLNTNGANDATFNTGGAGVNATVKAIRIQGDDKILVGGIFDSFNSLPCSNLIRLTTTGAMDAGFQSIVFFGGVNVLNIQTDGKIIVGWGEYHFDYFDQYDGQKIVRINNDGTTDNSFYADFVININENVFAIAIQNDGQILVGESLNSKFYYRDRYSNYYGEQIIEGSKDFKIHRYSSNGYRDQNFCVNHLQTGANRSVVSVITQPDGKVLIGGSFYLFNGATTNYIGRLNADGTKDVNFNIGGSGPNSKVNCIALQNDGKIIIAGLFTSYNNDTALCIVRLNADGSRDIGFNSRVYFPLGVTSLTIQPDGKVLAGHFGSIERLNVDGTKDSSFTSSISRSGFNFFPFIYAIALQADGKVLAGGSFTGNIKPHFTRLNTDGSSDNSFKFFGDIYGGAYGDINSIVVQPDGKIILGGATPIVRISPNGMKDTSFNNAGVGNVGSIYFMLRQNDGKIIIGGNLTSYNGNSINNLSRLNNDGSLDNSFNPGTGPNASVYSMAFQPNSQKFIIGGSYTSYNAFGKNRIARLYNCGSAEKTMSSVAVCSTQLPYLWNGNTYSAAGSYTTTLTGSGGCDSIVGLNLSIGTSEISGPTRACPYIGASVDSATYNVTVSPGSTITWSVSNTATMFILAGQGTTQAKIKYDNSFVSGTVYAKVVNTACGVNVKKSLAVNKTLPATPSTIIASTTNICPLLESGDGIIYSTRKVATATSYTWTSQAGTTSILHLNGFGVNDTTVLIRFANNFTTSAVTVKAVNDCGVSATRSITVTRANPSTPGVIAGPAGVCDNRDPNGVLAVYSVPAVAGLTYDWTVPSGAGYDQDPIGANTIKVIYPAGFTTGVVTVSGTNGCGTSNLRSLTVKANVPSAPGTITTSTLTSCPNRTYTYSTASIPANTNFVTWSVPAGGTITSGQGTNSISVSYSPGAISGYVSVTATNTCGTSAVRKIAVSLAVCPPVSPFAKNSGNTGDVAEKTIPKTEIPGATFNEMEVSVFPNPSIRNFHLLVSTPNKEVITMRLLDVAGRLIRENKISANEQIEFGAELNTGTYLVEVRQGMSVTTKRLIKF